MHINKTDKKILFELTKNSRQSLNKISKTVRIPKSSIQYKIKALEKNKTILKYYTFIDNSFLGTIYAKLSLNLFNTNKKELENIIEKLKVIKKISKIYITHGIYDLCLGVCANSIQNLHEIIEEIQEIIGENIRKQNIALVYETIICFPHIVFENNHIKPLKIHYDNKELDSQFDYDLLERLKTNSQINIVKLANELNASTTKVITHKKKLEKEKAILSYGVLLNFEHFEFHLYNVFWHFNKIIPERVNELKKYLIKIKETLFIYDTMGESNMECQFLCKNENELHQLISTIKEEFPNLISHYEIIIVTEIHKSEF